MAENFASILNLHPHYFNDHEAAKITNLLEENPQLASQQYIFDEGCSSGKYHAYPLHQAIIIGASIDVIEAIYDCSPPAIKAKFQESGYTALHLAFLFGAPSDVTLFIFKKWPEAAKEKDMYHGCLPLHYASHMKGAFEVLPLMMETWPNIAREKSDDDMTPLHCACKGGAPTEVISLILSSWPGAAKEIDCIYYTPLHYSVVQYNISTENVSSLLDQYPDALKETTEEGWTPLHIACRMNASLEVMLMLLEPFPEGVREKDPGGRTPLDLYVKFNSSEEVEKVLSFVLQLCENKVDNDSATEIMDFFVEIEWWNGVALIIDRFPSFQKCLGIDTKVFPQFLSTAGRHCMMKTIWHVMSNQLDVLEGVG